MSEDDGLNKFNKYLTNITVPVLGFSTFIFGDMSYQFAIHSGKYIKLKPDLYIALQEHPEYFTAFSVIFGVLAVATGTTACLTASKYFIDRKKLKRNK